MHVSTFDEPDTVWRQRSADLSWREIDGEVIVLDLKSANYLRLNSTGAKLWTRLETGATVGQLARCSKTGSDGHHRRRWATRSTSSPPVSNRA
jgi:hypothetical protein